MDLILITLITSYPQSAIPQDSQRDLRLASSDDDSMGLSGRTDPISQQNAPSQTLQDMLKSDESKTEDDRKQSP